MPSRRPATATIYHNPKCGTSRTVLGLLREAGLDVQVIEYLVTPPSRDTLKSLIAAMKRPVREVLRRKGTPYDELGLDDPALSDDQLIEMCENIRKGIPIATPVFTNACAEFDNHQLLP